MIVSLAILSAASSEPNMFYLTVFWNFLKDLVKAFLTNNNNTEYECLVMTFPPWFESTKHPSYTRLPKGSGIRWGSSSTATPYNSFQYALRLKIDSSKFGTLGSITNLFFVFFYRKWKIRYSASRWSSQGDAWYCDIKESYILISILPNSASYRNIPISWWNQDTCLASHYLSHSTSYYTPCNKVTLLGRLPLFNSISSLDNKYLIVCTAAAT